MGKFAENSRHWIQTTIVRLVGSRPSQEFRDVEHPAKDKALRAAMDAIDEVCGAAGVDQNVMPHPKVAEALREAAESALRRELGLPPLRDGKAVTNAAPRRRDPAVPDREPRPPFEQMPPGQLVAELQARGLPMPQGSLLDRRFSAAAVATLDRHWRSRNPTLAAERDQATPGPPPQTASQTPPVTDEAGAEDADHAEIGSGVNPPESPEGSVPTDSEYEPLRAKPSQLRHELESRGLPVPDGNVSSKAWQDAAIAALVDDDRAVNALNDAETREIENE